MNFSASSQVKSVLDIKESYSMGKKSKKNSQRNFIKNRKNGPGWVPLNCPQCVSPFVGTD